jgi:hypothetical protein
MLIALDPKRSGILDALPQVFVYGLGFSSVCRILDPPCGDGPHAVMRGSEYASGSRSGEGVTHSAGLLLVDLQTPSHQGLLGIGRLVATRRVTAESPEEKECRESNSHQEPPYRRVNLNVTLLPAPGWVIWTCVSMAGS